MAASSLIHSDSYLGAKFRHLRSRLGPGKATKAMAAHLARLIYRMLTRGQAWPDFRSSERNSWVAGPEVQWLQSEVLQKP